MTRKRITVAHGDGIGPEIMDATLRILKAAEAPLEYDEIPIGESLYKSGQTTGIAPESWDIIRRNKVLLKAPITTPLGGGYKSLNVTIRTTLNLFANVRPVKSYAPFVASPHPGINMVIIRENEEDLYTGIEHRQTDEVTQVLKLISRPGSERIIRYAFEYARLYGRKRVTCMTKDNIMKITDGRFHRVFERIAAEYPDIKSDHQIIDIGAARLAAQPERFDVIVTLNLYGDILSDIAAQVSGSVGLAGSANVGTDMAMFEAVHGSAPDIAGKDIANPSGLLISAVQMLVHIGEAKTAELINNAWLTTLESGIHPADVYREGLSQREVGTTDFTNAIIERLGEEPQTLTPVHYHGGKITITPPSQEPAAKELVGVDVFVDWSKHDRDATVLGKGLEEAQSPLWKLALITNRGVKVYPQGLPETFNTDHWRCRFMPANEQTPTYKDILALLTLLNGAGYDIIKTENLYTFNGEPGFSQAQGD